METKDDTIKGILNYISKGGLAAVAILLCLYFGKEFLTTNTEIQKELTLIKLQLVKIQAKLVDQDKIDNKIDNKIRQHQRTYHSIYNK